jgi:ArsR family transcriptional regulator
MDFGPDALDQIATRFKVLGETTRLAILNELRGGERTVSELVEALDARQANVSKHLGILHRHGLVKRRREGVHVHYRIGDPVVMELCELMCEGIARDLRARSRALEQSS